MFMQNYSQGHIKQVELSDSIWKYFFQGKLTFLHWNKGAEMAPLLGGEGGTLLVRKIPAPDPR